MSSNVNRKVNASSNSDVPPRRGRLRWNHQSALAAFVLLHLVALHTSIAAMEILAWSIFAFSVTLVASKKANVKWRPNDLSLWAALVGFLGWVGVSLMASPLSKPFWFQFGFMRWVIVLWGMVTALVYVWDKDFERRLIWLWMICLVMTGAYGAIQCLTGADFIRASRHVVVEQGGGLYKAVGFLSFSLTFAYCMGISTFAIFRPALTQGGKFWGGATLALGAMGILSSMSRGAWLAGLACAFVYILLSRPRLLLPALGVTAAGIAGLFWIGGEFATKISQMARLHMDNSSSIRVDIWRGYGQIFLEHPLFGVGLLSGDKFLPEAYAKLGIVQDFVSHAHNNALMFLAGTGVLGMGLFGVISLVFMIKAWRLRDVTDWGWSLFLAQLFMHLGGLTECNFIDGEVNHAVVFVWAMTWMLELKSESAEARSGLRPLRGVLA